jgi:hypothetical protein
MTFRFKRWNTSRELFGDVMVLGFLIVQCLDGAFTYLGVRTWGPGIEANPLMSSVAALYICAAILPWAAFFLTQ